MRHEVQIHRFPSRPGRRSGLLAIAGCGGGGSSSSGSGAAGGGSNAFVSGAEAACSKANGAIVALGTPQQEQVTQYLEATEELIERLHKEVAALDPAGSAEDRLRRRPAEGGAGA